MESFKNLGLTEKTIPALTAKGFEEPTEIQSLTIPLMLKNEIDIIAQAQTGTGKTAAFALPLIEMVKPSKKPQALILAPTRELVIQICEEFNSLKGKNKLSVAPIYGGQSIELQLDKLRSGVSIVAGTPGRVIDHINRKTLNLDDVQFVILDEGDEMLNMGFIEDIELILEHTPSEKRVLLFSATMPESIKKLAEKYMGPYTHLRTKTALTTKLTDQIYFEVAQADKFEALCRIIDMEPSFYGIVFCRTKIEVDEITSKLQDRVYSAEALHGDISQYQRESILKKFRKKQINILIATDVAARGIDIVSLTHVINFSLPQNPEGYVHRIGRTGRAGSQGTAITFVTSSEFGKLGFIKRVVKMDIQKKEIPEIEHIIGARKNRITDEIHKIASGGPEPVFLSWADELLEENNPRETVASVLSHSFSKIMDKSSYRQISKVKSHAPSGRALVEEEGQTRLFIAKGKKDGMTKKSLVEFIVKKAGVQSRIIDRVEVFDNFSFISAPFTDAERILERFKKQSQGKKSLVVKAKK
jgi:ATP-dependent RNA helicase DeaD